MPSAPPDLGHDIVRFEWAARFGLVVVIASVVASFTDWLFMGVLFHDKYLAAPEMWRFKGGNGQQRLIVYSQLIGVLSCGAFAYLCTQLNSSVSASLTAAVIVWLAGPVVVIAQMVLWTKLHPLVGASQSVGWLVRFIVTGVLCEYIGS